MAHTAPKIELPTSIHASAKEAADGGIAIRLAFADLLTASLCIHSDSWIAVELRCAQQRIGAVIVGDRGLQIVVRLEGLIYQRNELRILKAMPELGISCIGDWRLITVLVSRGSGKLLRQGDVWPLIVRPHRAARQR